MVKTGTSKPSKVEKSASSKSSADDSQRSSDIVSEDIDEVTIKEEPSDEDDPKYDSLVNRTFIVTKYDKPNAVSFAQKSGLPKTDDVLNVYTVDPTGFKRVFIAWGENARRLYKFFL